MAGKTIKLLGIQAGQGGKRLGAQDGPWMLREFGLVQKLTDLGHQVEDLGDIPGIHATRYSVTGDASLNNLPVILQINRHTHACVLGTMRKDPNAFLLVVGGDHSLAIGTLAGLADSCKRLGILWLDAHADFNDPGSSPSGNIHGMSLAVACGIGNRDLRSIADRDPMLDETDVYLLGVRDIDPGEQENLDEANVTALTVKGWRKAGLVQTVLDAASSLKSRCDHIHLSFDIDVLDPAEAPATGTPVAGGLSADEARQVLRALGESGLINSAEFVEYNPELDADDRTGKLTMELLAAFFGGA